MGLKKRHERGDYRPIFVALIDGADFLRLHPDARHLLFHVKLRLGPLGLAVHPGADSFSRSTGLKRPRVLRMLGALQKDLWIQEEGSLLWLVRGLEFEPQLSSDNPKHRTFIASEIAKLPRLAIVDRFRARYARFFEGVSDTPTDTPPDRVSAEGGMGMGITYPSPSTISSTPNTEIRDDDARAYAQRLVSAVNGALEAKLGSVKLLRADVERGRITDRWLADGVAVETAEQALLEGIERFTPEPHQRQPNSLKFFDNNVRQAHERATAAAPMTPADRIRALA